MGSAWPAEETDTLAPEFRYPRKVDLSPLRILAPATQTNWLHVQTPQENSWQITRPRFFANGDELKIRAGYFKAPAREESWIKLARANNPAAEITFPAREVCVIYGTRPASFHDFDGNGFCDLKLVFYVGGVSGHANVGRVYYLFQFTNQWRLVSFYIRDVSYTWECDLDGDGTFELLKAHHQDKEKFTYTNAKRKLGEKRYFQKYLFINAYKLELSGLKLCNHLSKALPMVFPWSGQDPFDIRNDAQFMKFNQFALPDGCTNQVQRIPIP